MAQSNVENMPPHTPKLPPVTGALAFIDETAPTKRSPYIVMINDTIEITNGNGRTLGEFLAPFMPYQMPPPTAPIENAPPKSLRMTQGLNMTVNKTWQLTIILDSGHDTYQGSLVWSAPDIANLRQESQYCTEVLRTTCHSSPIIRIHVIRARLSCRFVCVMSSLRLQTSAVSASHDELNCQTTSVSAESQQSLRRNSSLSFHHPPTRRGKCSAQLAEQ